MKPHDFRFFLNNQKTLCLACKQAAFTLIEILIVVTLLAITSAIIFPKLSATDPIKLDLALEQVVTALRFARQQAISTGVPHGILIDHDNSDITGKDLLVYQLDLSGNPFEIDHKKRHPINKNIYDISIPITTSINQNNLNIHLLNTTPAFSYETISSSQHIHFTHTGQPVYFKNSVPFRLLNGEIKVGNSLSQRSVLISPLNGRVSVQ